MRTEREIRELIEELKNDIKWGLDEKLINDKIELLKWVLGE